MLDVKISVIIPSYNVVKYIDECLYSVINQTLKEIEIICVDAKSTDGTLEIIKKYAIKDKRIKIIISEKKSYGYQMNIGIGEARGDFIGIVEADDYIQKNMYENLYILASSNHLDFIKAGFCKVRGRNKEYVKLGGEKYYNRVIDISKEKECFRFPSQNQSGIYNLNFLKENNVKHNETRGASFQDNGFWFQVFMYSKRAYFIEDIYYMLRRDNQNSSIYNPRKMWYIFKEYEFIENIITKDQELFDEYKYLYTYFAFRHYKWGLERAKICDRKRFFLLLVRKVKNFHKRSMISESLFKEYDSNLLPELISILSYKE